MTGTGDFGEKMNSMPKYVVSTTLDKVDWSGSKLIKGDVVGEVGKLKQEQGNDLLLSGSAQLFNTLMEADLIDVYRLMVHSSVGDGGARLFSDASPQKTLELTDTKVFGSGIVVLEYQPAKK